MNSPTRGGVPPHDAPVEHRLPLVAPPSSARDAGPALLPALPGGNIRNVVLLATALDPADDGGDAAAVRPIAAEQLVAALLEKYRKIGRTPPPQRLHARGMP